MVKALRVPVDGLSEGERLLDAEASHYVLVVHRLRVGDALTLFDPRSGLQAAATLERAQSKAAYCRVSVPTASSAVPGRSISLLQAFAKGEKVDRVVSEATALGVTEIRIVATERCVVRAETRSAEAERRRLRWERIAVDAARQSGRGDIPKISGPCELGEAVESLATGGLRLMLSPRAPVRISEVLREHRRAPVHLMIGPEGGLTVREEAMLSEAGFVGARFGEFILRTETCATAALGALLGWDEQS